MKVGRGLKYVVATAVAAVTIGAAGCAAEPAADPEGVGDEESGPEDDEEDATQQDASAAPEEAAGSAEFDEDRRLFMVGTNGPQHMDPVTAVTPCEAEQMRWVYDSLVRETQDGELVPGLAESWESPEPDRFVLNLRQDVQYQDGSAFTSEDVAFHLERALDDPGSTLASEAGDIESVETPDDHTVILQLAEPRSGIMPSILSDRLGMIPSSAAVEAAPETYGAEGAVGAGPYAYDTHVPKEHLYVDAWDGYWDRENRHLAGISMLGHVEEFHVDRMLTGDFQYANMHANEVGLVEEAVERGEPIDYVLSPTGEFTEIFVNWEVEPFDDVRVRRALQHALDRPLLVETLTEGTATVATSPLRSDHWAHDPATEDLYPYDPEKARELLSEAGYPDGLEVTVGMIEHPHHTRIAQAVQDMIEASGFYFELEPVTGAEINNRLYSQQDLPISFTAFSSPLDPGMLLERKFGSTGNSNPSGTAAEGVDELLAAGAATSDQDERAEHYQEVDRIIMEESLSFPLWHRGGLGVFTEELVGVTRGYTDCQFGRFVGASIGFPATE